MAAEEEKEDDAAWDDGEEAVLDSWDQIDVEEMPVPVKVKKEMRKEEKKRKKDLEKAAKAQDSPEPAGEAAAEAPAAAPAVEVTAVKSPPKAAPAVEAAAVKSPPKAAAAAEPARTEEVVEGVKKLSVSDSAGDTTEKKELSAEEKAAVKADREAKKAAKAAQRVAAKQKKVDPAASETAPSSAAPAAPKAGETGAEEEKKGPTKAERRAKQEAQRAAKAAAGGGGLKAKTESKIRVPDEMKADDRKTEKKLARTLNRDKVPHDHHPPCLHLLSTQVPARTPAQRQIALFSHLHQYEREASITRDLAATGGDIHPAVLQLGLRLAQGEVTGSSERCVSLLAALRTLLQDLLPSLTPGPELYKDIDSLIQPNITFLKQCRPLSISMQNAIRSVGLVH